MTRKYFTKNAERRLRRAAEAAERRLVSGALRARGGRGGLILMANFVGARLRGLRGFGPAGSVPV